MADVGVRELRQRLSEYLDRAERGELLRVTERGRPKALLGPCRGMHEWEEGVAERLDHAGSGGKPRPAAALEGSGGASSTRSRMTGPIEPLRRLERPAQTLRRRAGLARPQTPCSAADPALLTGRHTIVEVRRNLARLLDERDPARRRPFGVRAVDLGAPSRSSTSTRSPARQPRASPRSPARERSMRCISRPPNASAAPAVPFLTFDVRQAQAARALGLTVVTA